MIARWIELCARHRVPVFLVVGLLAVWGTAALRSTPLQYASSRMLLKPSVIFA